MSSGGSGELRGMAGGAMYRTAGLLAVFSVFLLVEGTVRLTLVTASNHDADWDGETDEAFPGVVLLIGAILEVLAGLAGLLRGLAVILFDHHSPAATRASLGFMLAGWFTFVVFVFADPAYAAANADASPVAGFTLGQHRAAQGLGIVGGVAVCAALQGGQVFFAWQLWMLERGQGAKYDAGYYSARLVYYSTLALLSGVSQTAIGILARDEIGEGRLEGPSRVAAPPYFIVYPELNIAAGLVVTFCAVAGYVRAALRNEAGRGQFAGAWAAAWLVQILLMAVTQLGLWSEGDLGARREVVFVSGMLVVLTLSLSVLPPYMDAMVHHPETKARQGGQTDSKMALTGV